MDPDRPSSKIPPDTHVTKRLAPNQPGSIKLARRFGDALVCVRYRHDPRTGLRFTTVELVVDIAPVRRQQPKLPAPPSKVVAIKIDWNDGEMRSRLIAAGALWDPRSSTWTLAREAADRMGLLQSAQPFRHRRPPRQP